MEEMRVEQLAAAVDVPVDTVRYYQSRGLIDPPRREGRVAWYGPSHRQRIVRIRELQAEGLTLATIGRLLRGELDASDEALARELAAPSDPDGSGDPPRARPPEAPGPAADTQTTDGSVTFSLDELAERTGVPLALLRAVEAEGLLIPRRVGISERYTPDDVASARAGLLLLEHGIPLGALLDLAREHHAATQRTAAAAVDLFATYIREPLRQQNVGAGPPAASASPSTPGPAGSEEAATAALLEAYTTLLPAVTGLVAHHFNRALTRAALARLEGDGTPAELHLAEISDDQPDDHPGNGEGISTESHSVVEIEVETLLRPSGVRRG